MQRTQSSGVWFWSSLDTAIAVSATLLCLLVMYVGPNAASASTVLAERLSVKNFLLLGLFLIFWTGTHQLTGLYRNPLRTTWQSLIFRAAAACALGSVFFLLFPLFSNEHERRLFTLLPIFFLAALCASITVRSIVWQLGPRIAVAKQRPTRTLIIGSGPIAATLTQSLKQTPKHSIIGYVDSPGVYTVSSLIDGHLLGTLDQLEQVLMSTAIDEVLIALPLRSSYDEIQSSIRACERAGVPVSYHFQPFSHTLGFAQVQERALQHYLSWRPSRIEEAADLKRATDIVAASLALVTLAPVFVIIAIAIKLTSRGPVFFMQERYGLNKKRFRMMKFRTMVADAEARQAALEIKNEAHGPVFKMRNDPRVTHLGRFLRKTSLDELPQFLNVLKGEMSLVGPRPLPLRDVANFNDAWLMRRFSVKPGLTCLWQIRGRSGTTFEQWIADDLEYIDTWSPMLDCRILLLTIPAVIRGSGAV